MKNSKWCLRLSIALAIVLGASQALAQKSFEINQFRPTERAKDGFVISTADDMGHLRFGIQLYADYSDDSLVAEDALGDSGSESVQLVHKQLTGHIVGSLGLWSRVILYFGVPYQFILREDKSDNFGALSPFLPTGSGIGDMWLGGRVRIWGERDDLFQLAAQGTLEIHTAGLADRDQYLRGGANGDPYISGRPELLFTFNLWENRIRVSGNIGMHFRDDVTIANLNIGDDLTFGAGAIVSAIQGRHGLDVIAEMYGRTGLSEKLGSSGFGNREETPIEILGGAKYHHEEGFTIGAGAGMGVARGYGAPDWRVFGMMGYTSPEAGPSKPGDRDGDGIIDTEDQCPAEPEDRDGFQDEDGCPDVDNDLDGVFDVDDRCPNEAGLATNEGCPDPDRDDDGVTDRFDNCPDEPGPVENHGCKERQLVEIKDGRLDILEKVYFKTNSASIDKRSHKLLANVAQVINAHPEIKKVEVEGHTDNRGSDAYNLKLSQRRVDSVVQYLVEQNVEPGRLKAVGYGEAKPIVPDAKTPEELAQNRRVEFTIVEN